MLTANTHSQPPDIFTESTSTLILKPNMEQDHNMPPHFIGDLDPEQEPTLEHDPVLEPPCTQAPNLQDTIAELVQRMLCSYYYHSVDLV